MTQMLRKNWQDGEWVTIPLVYNDNSETDTGFDIPKGCVIYPWEFFLIVDTVDATETIEVGILSTESGGDADGFIDAFSIATGGVYNVMNMVTITDASNAIYYSANTIGDLFFAGYEWANTSGNNGCIMLKAFRGDGLAESISYTCSAGSDVFVGRLCFRLHFTPWDV